MIKAMGQCYCPLVGMKMEWSGQMTSPETACGEDTSTGHHHRFVFLHGPIKFRSESSVYKIKVKD